MSRIEPFHPDTLNDEQQAIYDGIAGGKRASGPQLFDLTDDQGRLNGPFNALLLSPPVGAALSALGEAIRYGTKMPDRVREIAILVVAQEYKSEFEWYAHEAISRHIGIGDDLITSIRSGEKPTFDDPEEEIQYDFCLELIKTRRINDDLYEEVDTIAGPERAMELASLVGYYTSLSLIMNVFKVGAPEGVNPVFQD